MRVSDCENGRNNRSEVAVGRRSEQNLAKSVTL